LRVSSNTVGHHHDFLILSPDIIRTLVQYGSQ